MSGPNDRSFLSPVEALRREAANWRCRCRAAEVRVADLESRIAGLQAEVATIKARLAQVDPRYKNWPRWIGPDRKEDSE